VRTKYELRIYAPLATRAQRQVVEILQEVLLFQGALKRLVKSLLGTQDEIEQEPWHKEQDYQKRREHLRKNAPTS
jgi:hypothetical protein